MKLDKEYGWMKVGNDYYSFDRNREGKLFFKKEDTAVIKGRIKRAKLLAAKLKEGIDGEKILTESLLVNFTVKDFDKLYAQVFNSKRKYKPRTRAHHCVDMKVGNVIIPIMNT